LRVINRSEASLRETFRREKKLRDAAFSLEEIASQLDGSSTLVSDV